MAKERLKEYNYIALDKNGKKKKGTLEASSESRAYSMLQAQGLSPIKVMDKGKDILQAELKIPGITPKASMKSLAVFCRQFSLLIRAGIPMLEALAISTEQTEHKVLKKSLGEVHDDVEEGMPLSNAMRKHPNSFPELLTSIVAVGEEGGFLDESLDSMAKTYKTELELKQKVKSAMTYPVIVVSITVLILTAMLVFVVPVFGEMFDSLNAELPAATQLLVDLSENMVIVIPIMLTVLAATVFFFKKYKNEEWMKSRVDKFKLKAPVFGNLNTKLSVARFSSNLSMMLHSGVPLIQSLRLVASTANNWLLSKAIEESVEGMENGKSFSASIESFDMFPDMVKNMIVVGENSGSMGVMLETVAEFYDEEVKELSGNLATAIEPLLIVFLGVMIGGMLLALYMPMFTLFNAMSS